MTRAKKEEGKISVAAVEKILVRDLYFIKLNKKMKRNSSFSTSIYVYCRIFIKSECGEFSASKQQQQQQQFNGGMHIHIHTRSTKRREDRYDHVPSE